MALNKEDWLNDVKEELNSFYSNLTKYDKLFLEDFKIKTMKVKNIYFVDGNAAPIYVLENGDVKMAYFDRDRTLYLSYDRIIDWIDSKIKIEKLEKFPTEIETLEYQKNKFIEAYNKVLELENA